MSTISSQFLLILVVILTIFALEIEGNSGNAEEIRVKRSYYGGYDMYGDDFWYAGRIIGIIVGVCLLLFCCCLPCVCIAGIWFAGWFGLRNRRQQKTSQQAAPPPPQPVQSSNIYPNQSIIPVNYENTPGNANYIPRRQQQQPIHVDSSPRDSNSSPAGHVIFTGEDRYYTSSTAPATVHRPDAYNSSRY